MRASITPDGKEYSFKIMTFQDDENKIVKTEVLTNKNINNNTGAPTLRYYACYIGADSDIDKLFMIM